MNEGIYPLVTHLGAGDGILQSGMTVALLKRYEKIAFPCYPQYKVTFEDIFWNHPNISVYTVPFNHGEDWGGPRDATFDRAIEDAGMAGRPHIRAGNYSGRGIGWDFSKSFYEHVNVPYEERWLSCPIRYGNPSVPFLEWPKDVGRKIFLHDDPSRGFNIFKDVDRNSAFVVPREKVSESMLQYAYLIDTADEIHCIDSSFFHLVDSLDPVGQLYLHCYARWPRPREFRYHSRFNWHYLW